MLHVEYPFDLGVGEVSSAGAKHNTLGLLRMSVPVTATADDKHAMHFWLSHGLVWYYAFNHEVSDTLPIIDNTDMALLINVYISCDTGSN
jgi:hypothetical protein